MKLLLHLVFLASVSLCCANVLRISEVADRASDVTEKMTMTGMGSDKVLFVKKVSVIGDADVRQAVPNYGLNNDFYVELTDKGAEKLEKLTEGMVYGSDRLAIIVEGRLVSAPVVQAPLGGDFVISGLDDRSPEEIDDLARKMSRRPPRPKGVEPAAVKKGLDRKPPTLKVIYPQMDTSAEIFDVVAFVEGIKILDPKVSLNIHDLGGLMSTTMVLEKAVRTEKASALSVDSKCQFVEVLARNFGEVATLTSNAGNGRIPIKSLTNAMIPYIQGDKNWPIRKQQGEQASPSDGDKLLK